MTEAVQEMSCDCGKVMPLAKFRVFLITLNNKNETNDWGNVHGLILFLEM